jgi:hypothetical protein
MFAYIDTWKNRNIYIPLKDKHICCSIHMFRLYVAMVCFIIPVSILCMRRIDTDASAI